MDKKSLFSKEYWYDIYYAIREVINEEGYKDNIAGIKENIERRCVVITLEELFATNDEEEIEDYYASKLSFLKESMKSWELNPFKKYEYDGYITYTLYVKAESTIQRYEKEYDDERPTEEQERLNRIADYFRYLQYYEAELKKNQERLDKEMHIVEISKAHLEELKAMPREKNNSKYFKRLQTIKEIEKVIEKGIDDKEIKRLKKEIKDCKANIKCYNELLKELGAL